METYLSGVETGMMKITMKNLRPQIHRGLPLALSPFSGVAPGMVSRGSAVLPTAVEAHPVIETSTWVFESSVSRINHRRRA